MTCLRTLQTALLACVVALTPGLARAQVGSAEEASKYNADYYTAGLNPTLKVWLALVEKGHVNERIWNAFSAGQYSAALDDTKYALERFPNHPRALGLMGEIGKATSQLSLPINAYEYALKLYPQYAFTHAQYGHFLIEIGAVSAGVAELREALRLDPDLVSARAWLHKVESANQPKPAAKDTAGTD